MYIYFFRIGKVYANIALAFSSPCFLVIFECKSPFYIPFSTVHYNLIIKAVTFWLNKVLNSKSKPKSTSGKEC